MIYSYDLKFKYIYLKMHSYFLNNIQASAVLGRAINYAIIICIYKALIQ